MVVVILGRSRGVLSRLVSRFLVRPRLGLEVTYAGALGVVLLLDLHGRRRVVEEVEDGAAYLHVVPVWAPAFRRSL